jgi:cell shape-determining protein MreC
MILTIIIFILSLPITFLFLIKYNKLKKDNKLLRKDFEQYKIYASQKYSSYELTNKKLQDKINNYKRYLDS